MPALRYRSPWVQPRPRCCRRSPATGSHRVSAGPPRCLGFDTTHLQLDLLVLQLLAVAIRAGNVPRVLDLLPQQTTPLGFSLLEAACCGQRDVLELLIDAAGVMPLTSTADALGRTPLHLAAANGDYGAAQLLIARGADVNVSCNVPLGWLPTLQLKLAAAGMRVFIS